MFSAARNYIIDSQHGFIPKRSSATNLPAFASFCLWNIDAGVQIDAINTNLKVLFDAISLDILIVKLHKLRFATQIVVSLYPYITARYCLTMVKDHISGTFKPPREFLKTVTWALFYPVFP